MRPIEEVLRFRTDLSPFLVHLTRSHKDTNESWTAKDCLLSIIKLKQIFQGVLELTPENLALSDARYADLPRPVDDEKKWEFFGFSSFTETPLSEIHCLLGVRDRTVELEPYGLVFLKDRLKLRGVSPVFYVNNTTGNAGEVLDALVSLITTHPRAAAQILPLVATFGRKLKSKGPNDFIWEREWRLPYSKSLGLNFDKNDVFIGLCPDEEIEEFQDRFPGVEFIDPRLNAKHYAAQLIRARKRLKLKHSVV